MIGSRAKARCLTAALTGPLLIALAGEALAQAGPPVRLTPPPMVTRDAAPPAPAPAAGSERPSETPAPLIEVGRTAPIATDSVGLHEPGKAGLPPGGGAWDGSRRDLIDRLIVALPSPVVSMPARDLAKRILLVSGPPPADPPASTTTPETKAKTPTFVGLRATKVMAIGDSEAAANLARLVPQRLEDDELSRVLLDAAFAAYDHSGACTLTRGRLDRLNDAYWQKAFIFCQALANEHGRAQLGLTMLRETNAPDDPVFARLIANLGGDARSTVTGLPEATPLHLAMLRATRQNVPPDLANSGDPVLLRMIATTPNATADTRLIAAERAEAFGSLSAEALGQLYDSVTFNPDQLANALTFAQGDKGPRGRAVMYRAAKAQTVAVGRAEALQRSWRLARERGGYATAVRVALPLLADMQPSQELVFFAPDAVRALTFAGRLEEARAWRTVLRAEAATGNELATTAETLLWPIVWLADSQERTTDKTPVAARFAAWREAQEKAGTASTNSRAALLATLLASSGERPDVGLVASLLSGSLGRDSMPMPNLGLWLGLGAALESGRTGETALFSLSLLGGDGAAGAAPHTVALVLDALRAVGLDADARALAVETAIAAGL